MDKFQGTYVSFYAILPKTMGIKKGWRVLYKYIRKGDVGKLG